MERRECSRLFHHPKDKLQEIIKWIELDIFQLKFILKSRGELINSLKLRISELEKLIGAPTIQKCTQEETKVASHQIIQSDAIEEVQVLKPSSDSSAKK